MREPAHLNDHSISVLLVDGRSAALGDLIASLQPLGLNVIEARSSSDVPRAAHGRSVAVALLGVYVGGPDPAGTVRMLREDASEQPPIIFLADSGLTRFSGADAYSLGAVDYLVRPVLPFILRAKVAAFVDLRRQAETARRQASREKDDYLAWLGRELRNQLAPITETLDPLEQAGASEGAETARSGPGPLTRLIDDAVDVAALSSGEAKLNLERLDLARVVRSTSEGRRALLSQARLELDVVTPSTPLWVTGDRIRIVQMIDSLLDNVARSSPTGGRVTVAAEADPRGQVAVVRVRATGIRTQPKTTGQPLGGATRDGLDRARSGPGLALVRAVIARLGGTFSAARHAPGSETEFTATLPTEGEPPALSAAPQQAQAVASGRRVLVVEDNRDAATSLSVLLGLMGHDVRVAYTGPDGVAIAAEWPPEIIISDLGLPGFDGFEVARRLRCQLGSKPLLVALTGYGRDEDRRQSREAGFDHHLVKPADPAVIQRMVATAR
jgi:DNA-binding response OmpR family regulator